MICKLLLGLCAISCIVSALEAASVPPGLTQNTKALVEKLDYEGVETNVRNARQAYAEEESDDESNEEDEEDDAELHQSAIRRQQAYQQSTAGSQESSDEDNFEEDVDDDSYGRRVRRDVLQTVDNTNKVEEISRPSKGSDIKEKQPAKETTSNTASTSAPSNTDFSNTSVLILIRDVIKKVTELPNTQQVATSAQQYFQLFEHFLQQTIKQVIGEVDDDDEEEEAESTTVTPETEKETESESESVIQTQPSGNSDKPLESDAGDKNSIVPQLENMSAEINKIKS